MVYDLDDKFGHCSKSVDFYSKSQVEVIEKVKGKKDFSKDSKKSSQESAIRSGSEYSHEVLSLNGLKDLACRMFPQLREGELYFDWERARSNQGST